MILIDEAAYEDQFIDWLKGIGGEYKFGPEMAHDGSSPERESYKDVVLVERLSDAISRLNPGLPKEAFRWFSHRAKVTH